MPTLTKESLIAELVTGEYAMLFFSQDACAKLMAASKTGKRETHHAYSLIESIVKSLDEVPTCICCDRPILPASNLGYIVLIGDDKMDGSIRTGQPITALTAFLCQQCDAPWPRLTSMISNVILDKRCAVTLFDSRSMMHAAGHA